MLDKLPFDVLQKHIFGNVDKFEHLKLVLDDVTKDEIPQMKELIEFMRNKIDCLNRVDFNEIKELYKALKKQNKKNQGKPDYKEKVLFVTFINTRTNKPLKIQVTSVAIKYIHGISCEGDYTNWILRVINNIISVEEGEIGSCFPKNEL